MGDGQVFAGVTAGVSLGVSPVEGKHMTILRIVSDAVRRSVWVRMRV